MINREKILEILKQYHFDSDKYMVISGAAMVLYGIKEFTNDIDIAVTREYYDYLLEKYDCKFDCYDSNGNKCYYIDNFINFGLKYYSNNKDNSKAKEIIYDYLDYSFDNLMNKYNKKNGDNNERL